MLPKLSRQVDQVLEVLTRVRFPCRNDTTKLERLRLTPHEIKKTMSGFRGKIVSMLTDQK